MILFLLGCSHNKIKNMAIENPNSLQIKTHVAYGTPEWIQGSLLDLSGIKKEKRAEMVLEFLGANTALFRIEQPRNELLLLEDEQDEMGFHHLRYARLHEKIPIWNDELVVHINKESQLYLINGQYHASSKQNGAFLISTEKAAEIARTHHADLPLQTIEENKPCWYAAGADLRPAYHLILASGAIRWEFMVAADTGEILLKHDLRRY